MRIKQRKRNETKRNFEQLINGLTNEFVRKTKRNHSVESCVHSPLTFLWNERNRMRMRNGGNEIWRWMWRWTNLWTSSWRHCWKEDENWEKSFRVEKERRFIRVNLFCIQKVKMWMKKVNRLLFRILTKNRYHFITCK